MALHESGDLKPLPERVRPKAFDDVLGQERIWEPGSALRRLVESDRFHSLLFWGPPGSGKTSLAQVIGQTSGRTLVVMSAVIHGVKDMRGAIDQSQKRLDQGERSLLLFMDEIHRLSKSQQDVLLPALESGIIRFIGATTENPSFEVNSAVLSRSLVFKFERLTEPALESIMRRALHDPQSALTRLDVEAEVLQAVARAADGDARRALNLLEALLTSAPPEQSPVNLAALKDVNASFNLRYDKAGDAHYDTISAFIKSIRASQPDGAVYYLARMLDSGEDPVFIARRLVIAASEDIGNANPTALLVATAAMQAVHMVGMPEARIMLSQATTYLAASPKSNRAYLAINKALDDVRSLGSLEIPLHLRNAPTKLMKDMGYGQGYVYAHDDAAAAQKLAYLPAQIEFKRYYEPLEAGAEAQLKRNLEQLRRRGCHESPRGS